MSTHSFIHSFIRLKYALPALAFMGMVSCNPQNAFEGMENGVLTKEAGHKKDKGGDLPIMVPTVLPIEPIFRSQLPSFHPLAYHLIAREFVAKYPASANNFPEYSSIYMTYMENRLIALYPETAYTGMVSSGVGAAQAYWADYGKFEQQKAQYEAYYGPIPSLASSDTEFDLLPKGGPSLKEEETLMDFNSDETVLWNSLEVLAAKKGKASAADLAAAIAAAEPQQALSCQTKMFLSVGAVTAVIMAKSGPAAAIIGAGALYVGYRAWLAQKRAEEKQGEFFSTRSGVGQQGDAFRHVYVSMLLRKSLSRPLSAVVMSAYEAFCPNEEEQDTQMDLQNNKTGRDGAFSLLDVRGNWKDWAISTRNFINNPANAAFYNHWQTASDAVIKAEEVSTADARYIYYIF